MEGDSGKVPPRTDPLSRRCRPHTSVAGEDRVRDGIRPPPDARAGGLGEDHFGGRGARGEGRGAVGQTVNQSVATGASSRHCTTRLTGPGASSSTPKDPSRATRRS